VASLSIEVRRIYDPSTERRRWYGREPERFAEFSHRYLDELRRPPGVETVPAILMAASSRSPLVLLPATKDVGGSR
jgi:uncharacterized protein YeaO (DUF488 family)